ncbi:hypothetical protein [Streptomyces sp. NPDC059076]|uniref:hypothetical protein n=1 Tax=unclassified Streptomyces TaxID=2593676 RepID=UPI0036C7A9EB
MRRAPIGTLANEPALAPSSRERRALLTAGVRSLVVLRERGELTSVEVKTVARSVGVHERTVWRRLKKARATGIADLAPRSRYTVTDEVRIRLAYYRGNIKRVHQEMLEEADAPRRPGAG